MNSFDGQILEEGNGLKWKKTLEDGRVSAPPQEKKRNEKEKQPKKKKKKISGSGWVAPPTRAEQVGVLSAPPILTPHLVLPRVRIS